MDQNFMIMYNKIVVYTIYYVYMDQISIIITIECIYLITNCICFQTHIYLIK